MVLEVCTRDLDLGKSKFFSYDAARQKCLTATACDPVDGTALEGRAVPDAWISYRARSAGPSHLLDGMERAGEQRLGACWRRK